MLVNFTPAKMVMSVLIVGYACGLSACTTNSGAHYQPIVDAPKTAAYQKDLGECQGLARQRKYINGDTKSDSMIGAGLGSIVGAVDARKNDTLEGALVGAVVGGFVGGSGSALRARQERKYIVMNCLAGRGYHVIG